MIMPFGKYKGQHIDDIPEDYIRWCLENLSLTAALDEEMSDQLILRKGEGISRKLNFTGE